MTAALPHRTLAIPNKPQKILILRVGALGDIVFLLPCLSLLRKAYPEAEIHWLVKKSFLSLVEDHPAIDKFWTLNRGLGGIAQAARLLRRERFDLVLDYHGNLRSGFLSLATGAKYRVGFEKPFTREQNHWFNPYRVTPEGGLTRHKVDRNLDLTRALPGVDPSLEAAVDWPAEPETQAKIVETLTSFDWTPENKFVILQSGTSIRGQVKLWFEDRFVALGKRLIAEKKARILLLWGSKDEREKAQRIQEQTGAGSFLLETRPSFKELLAWLRQADLLVGADTGPMHLANALGSNVIGIFGPKDPKIYHPYFAGGVAISKNAEAGCPPCNMARCDNPKGRVCLEAVAVEHVFDAAEQILDSQ